MRTLVLTALTALAAFALAPATHAAEILRHDDQGRAIRLDVRADGVDADWYAPVLSRAVHTDDISTVTIRIDDDDDLASSCGRHAGGCYRDGRGDPTLIVPAGRSTGLSHTLLHEYAHHIDATHHHGGIEEPNGTRAWWRVRGMAQLVRQRSVARSYRFGWDRSIAEIFAEDYARTQLDTYYAIRWLEPPGPIVRQAILADLGRGDPPTGTQPPSLRRVVIERAGRLRPGDSVSIPFGLLGPGRRVTFSATVTGAEARLAVTCRRPVAAKQIGPGQGRVTLDLRNLGPAECSATLTDTGAGTLGYSATLRLSIDRR